MIWRSQQSTRLTLAALAAISLLGGCVRRELTIHSEPEGALVYLNDLEVGRTPVTRPFTFYGTYDVVLRKEGYETLKAKKLVLAPWWQWVPVDLVAELFPLTDRQSISFEMKPATTQAADPSELVERAVELRGRMTSRPAPATKPVAGAAGAATQP